MNVHIDFNIYLFVLEVLLLVLCKNAEMFQVLFIRDCCLAASGDDTTSIRSPSIFNVSCIENTRTWSRGSQSEFRRIYGKQHVGKLFTFH